MIGYADYNAQADSAISGIFVGDFNRSAMVPERVHSNRKASSSSAGRSGRSSERRLFQQLASYKKSLIAAYLELGRFEDVSGLLADVELEGLEVEFVKFQHKKTTYDFPRSLPVRIVYEEEAYVFENRELRLFGLGVDIQEAYEDIQRSFHVIYQEYVNTSDQLSDSGQAYSRQIMAVVN